jgi:hypothetical protein
VATPEQYDARDPEVGRFVLPLLPPLAEFGARSTSFEAQFAGDGRDLLRLDRQRQQMAMA